MSEVNESTGRVQEMKKFVRYADGARMYSMGLTKFQQLAKDANARYKIGQLVLVNTEILDKYLEAYPCKECIMQKRLFLMQMI